MTRPVVSAGHLEPGATWAFTTRSGKRSEYVFEKTLLHAGPSPDPNVPGLSAIHELRNVETGGFSRVSEKWMTEGQIAGAGPFWEPLTEAATPATPQEAAAA